MKSYTFVALAIVLVVATSAFGLEQKAYQIRDDFGVEPLYDCALQYYYYIPCPTYSWFWVYTGWSTGDRLGVEFNIGDQGTGGYDPCDPGTCHELETLRILDFAGYGTVYPGMFTIEIDVWCPPCPYTNLWNSGPVETHFGWNYIDIIPPLCLTPCYDEQKLTVAITATHVGVPGSYPAWGWDNLGSPIRDGCVMHDYGCMPAVPRFSPHSGIYRYAGVEYCPPEPICEPADTTPDCSQLGFIELAWRIYLICSGPSATESSTWGNIKRIYWK